VRKRTESKRTGKWILISALELHPSGEGVPLFTVRLSFASILRKEAPGYDQRYCYDQDVCQHEASYPDWRACSSETVAIAQSLCRRTAVICPFDGARAPAAYVKVRGGLSSSLSRSKRGLWITGL
jgi:hypothetical protein